MCGIVGIFRHNMTNLDVDLFERMLLADVFRGDHSTGVFRLLADKINSAIYKDATPSPFYLYSKGWNALRGDTVPGKDQLQPLSPLYVGHNRYATMGAKTPENAHPFNVGKITLVHNGSIAKYKMSNTADFDVDSHGICDLIDKKGLDEALKEMDGAFALVWWNSEEKTLNFFRNEKRPMQINKYSDGTYAWASEGAMLDWIFTRKGSTSTVVKTLERSFELPVGMLFQLHYDGTTITELGFIKKTLPTFPYYSSGYSGSSYSGRGYSGYVSPTEEERFDERLKEAGICLKDISTPSNQLIVKLDNVSFTRTGTITSTGQLEAELFGLDTALSMLEEEETEEGVYYLEGYLDSSSDVNIMAYSVDTKLWEDTLSSADEIFADIINIYTSGQGKEQKLKITVKNLRTTLTAAEKDKLLNDMVVPLAAEWFETVDGKDVVTTTSENLAKQTALALQHLDEKLTDLDGDDIPFGTGTVVEATVQNRSGTIRSVKSINETETECHFCRELMDVDDFKQSTTWCDKKSLICSFCSTMV